MAMDKEMKAKWVAALRSGEYMQGRAALKIIKDGETRHCCLGVLCDVAAPGDWGEQVVTCVSWREATGSLPAEFVQEIGISELDEFKLIDMNDGGSTFPQIAGYIESNL